VGGREPFLTDSGMGRGIKSWEGVDQKGAVIWEQGTRHRRGGHPLSIGNTKGGKEKLRAEGSTN